MILYLLITLNHVYFNHNSTIINTTNNRILHHPEIKNNSRSQQNHPITGRKIQHKNR